MCDWDWQRDTYCPELWAQDSNALVCDYAYGRLPAGYDNGTDLLTDSDYARGAFHIVENQMAKAAWRLSGWLNYITHAYFRDSEMDLQMQSLPGGFEVDTPEGQVRLASSAQAVLGDFEL